MASIFMIQRAKSSTVVFVFLCASVANDFGELFLRRVRPLLIPLPQHKLTVVRGVSLVAENCKSFVESPKKLFAIALLNLLRFAAGFGCGLPIVYLRRNPDSGFLLKRWIPSRCQQCFNASGFQPPLGDETVAGKATLQRR